MSHDTSPRGPETASTFHTRSLRQRSQGIGANRAKSQRCPMPSSLCPGAETVRLRENRRSEGSERPDDPMAPISKSDGSKTNSDAPGHINTSRFILPHVELFGQRSLLSRILCNKGRILFFVTPWMCNSHLSRYTSPL